MCTKICRCSYNKESGKVEYTPFLSKSEMSNMENRRPRKLWD